MSTFESLENRQLMSVTLVDGLLKVVGTNGDDEIAVQQVRINYEDGRAVRKHLIGVRINDEIHQFYRKRIEHIELRGRGGNDILENQDWVRWLTTETSPEPFDKRIVYYGGEGNDYLVAHDDMPATLYGGGGDDRLRSVENILGRLVNGGTGNDELRAGNLATVIGGAGADQIFAMTDSAIKRDALDEVVIW